MHDLEPGRAVGGFVIKEKLGKGGMGEVYLVHDQKLRVDRALKVISPSTKGEAHARVSRERFLREARLLARMRHPNIIPVHEVGELGGVPFIVMTYFPGRDGRTWLRQENAGVERIRVVAEQLASALVHAHEQSVLHRDIKPSNVLIGKDDKVMLIDFGLAKADSDERVTVVGNAMGTYNYLAPEYVTAALSGGGEHTVLTDLWSFGCLLYSLTCRRLAFSADGDLKLLHLIKEARFVPVQEARPDVPEAWAKLIHELMEADPAKRMQTARAALDRIQALSFKPADVPPAAFSGIAPANDPPPHGAGDDAKNAAPEDGKAGATARATPSESLFDHANDTVALVATAPTKQPPQPTFEARPEPPSSARSRAKKSLLLPVAAAASVFLIGGGLILWADSAAGRRKSTARSAFVDPEELKRKQRAEQELADLGAEHAKRDVPAPRDAPTPLMPVVIEAPPNEAPPRGERVEKTYASPRQRSRAAAPSPVVVDDPWARRYGSRTTFNSSVAPVDAGAPRATATTAATAGVKIPVRVRDAIASAPAGPVIAVVETPTKIGDIQLPKNTELHGRTVGTSGPRIFVEFTFAVIDGHNIALRGTALGRDGRAGVPGAKSIGGVSDVAAGGAAGAVQALIDVAAAATSDTIAQGAIRGAGAPTSGKTSLLNNEEQLVTAERGARFFVYVDSFI